MTPTELHKRVVFIGAIVLVQAAGRKRNACERCD
jgi:hypothetical protein